MSSSVPVIPESTRQYFAGMYLLEYMAHRPTQFKVFLESENQDLEPILEWLASQSYVQIVEVSHEAEVPQGFFKKIISKINQPEPPAETEKYYRLSPEGQVKLEEFLLSYSEYLFFFDIFSAIDLEAGEFAFGAIEEHHQDKESFPSQSWINFVQNERFDDLRIAVAQYLNKDPIEIVFAHFLNEGRFGRSAFGWQFDLLLGSVWEEIAEIVQSSIQLKDLSYENQEGYVVEAESVLEDILTQAAEILENLTEGSEVLEVKAPTQSENQAPKILSKPLKSIRQAYGI